jgi:DNA-binding CsgD family transcriptional regulator
MSFGREVPENLPHSIDRIISIWSNSTPTACMDQYSYSEIPSHRLGSEWSSAEIEHAKDWFARVLMAQAVSVALVQLVHRGYPDPHLAADSVSEWLCGRVNSLGELSPSRFGRAIRGFDPGKGDLPPFLFQDLRLYISGTILRRLSVESRLEPLDSIQIEDAGSSLTFRVSVRDLTRQVMAALSEKDRAILSLASEGHSIEEIAKMNKCSSGSVKTAISRARSHARDELDRIAHEQRLERGG